MKCESYIDKSILWDITRRCNLNCTHCYNSGNKAIGQEIDIQHDYKIIVDMIGLMEIKHIHLLGGEPLMVKGLFELLNYAQIKGIMVSINTNGTLLSKEMIEKLVKSNVAQLTISLDGATEETNDRIRGTGSYKKVVENIKQTTSYITQAKSNMIVQVATVITKQNIQSIHRLPRILHSLSVQYLDVLKLYKCGNAISNDTALQISNEDYLVALGKLMVESYRNQIFAQFDCKPKVLELLSLKYGFKANYNGSGFSSCSAGQKILFMDYKGNIYPCGPFAHEFPGSELVINIFNDQCVQQLPGIEEGIHSRIEQYSLSGSACKACQFNNCCSGCAICYNDYDKLCETAIRLYSVTT